MSRSTEKFQRWIELITFLAGRRYPVPWEQVACGVSGYAAAWASEDETARDSVRRKFERDKKDLRELGIPLEVVGGSGAEEGGGRAGGAGGVEGYLLRDGDFFLPYLTLVERAVGARPDPVPVEPSPEGAPVGDRERALRERLARRGTRRPASPPGTVALTADEASVALEALRLVETLPAFPLAADARSALLKLRAELGLPDPDSPLLLVERPGVADVRDRVERLAGAVLERREVRFRYRAMSSDEVTERRVRPLGLLLQWGYWYLVAWDASRDGMRQFGVGRMDEVRFVRPGGGGGEFEVPDDFQLDRWLRRPAWTLDAAPDGEGVTARVYFPHPWSDWAARNEHGEPEEEGTGAGTAAPGGGDPGPGAEGGGEIRRFHVRQPDAFLRWLLGLEARATLVDPPELREGLAGMARAVLRAHGEPGGPDA